MLARHDGGITKGFLRLEEAGELRIGMDVRFPTMLDVAARSTAEKIEDCDALRNEVFRCCQRLPVADAAEQQTAKRANARDWARKGARCSVPAGSVTGVEAIT